MKQMWCVRCEQDIMMFSGHDYPEFHIDFSVDSLDNCFGFFTSCPPPEMEDNWQDNLVEPSEDEWTKINLNANELLMDFVGV